MTNIKNKIKHQPNIRRTSDIRHPKYPNFSPPFSKKNKDEIIGDIYSGALSIDALDSKSGRLLLDTTKNELTKGMKEGFKISYGAPDKDFISALEDNIFNFSAAKTYVQAKEMSSALVDEDGERRSLDEFKETVSPIFDVYNESYLESEYNTAITAGRVSSMWKVFDKNADTYGQVQWLTPPDEMTCDECSDMDGFVAAKDDDIWDEISPGNIHYNCRCTLIEVDGEEESEQDDVPDSDESIGNFKDGQVFSDEHPYFDEVLENED